MPAATRVRGGQTPRSERPNSGSVGAPYESSARPKVRKKSRVYTRFLPHFPRADRKRTRVGASPCEGDRMSFAAPPPTAAWRHQDARSGFEVAYFHLLDDGYCIEGCTTAIEGGQTWAVDYAIALDANWTTRRACAEFSTSLLQRSDVGAGRTGDCASPRGRAKDFYALKVGS